VSEPAAPAAPAAPEPVHAEPGTGPGPAAAPAEDTDHKGLLRELAGHIRDIPLPGRNKHVTDLLAWLASHHM